MNILAFALRIEAAGLNRRLKQDIVDQDPEFTREGLKRVSFFEPEPSEEALYGSKSMWTSSGRCASMQSSR